MPTNTYYQIGKTVLGSAGTITFSGISSEYTDLRIVIKHAITNSGYALCFRINDNASGYNQQMTRGISGNASGYQKTGMVCGFIHSQTGTGAVKNLATVDFFSYAKTDRYKSWTAQCASNPQISATDVGLMVGNWDNTSAITKITIAEGGDGGTGTYNTGNLAAGTSAILYGIKGA
jgi:hypothetical protein